MPGHEVGKEVDGAVAVEAVGIAVAPQEVGWYCGQAADALAGRRCHAGPQQVIQRALRGLAIGVTDSRVAASVPLVRKPDPAERVDQPVHGEKWRTPAGEVVSEAGSSDRPSWRSCEKLASGSV